MPSFHDRNTVKRAQITRINSKFVSPDAFALRKVGRGH
jgi:hypothetical protein